MTVYEPSAKECRNLKEDARKKTILCVATGFYPDHVTVFWQIDGKNITRGVATSDAKQNETSKEYSITSRLRVSADDWHDQAKKFTCVVTFFDGKSTSNHTKSVFGKIGTFM